MLGVYLSLDSYGYWLANLNYKKLNNNKPTINFSQGNMSDYNLWVACDSIWFSMAHSSEPFKISAVCKA
jgi:hypothetical protein